MELLETFSFTYFVTCRDLPDRPRLDYWTILLHVRRPLSVCWLRFDHHFISTSHHIAPFRSEMWRILRLMTPGQWSVIRRRLEVLQYYDLQSAEGSECNVNISPCSCVITLALLIRSVIPYQWFLSHCDPSHTNAPLTPPLYVLALSLLSHHISLFEAWLVQCSVYHQKCHCLCFDCVVQSALLSPLLEINCNSGVWSAIMQTMTHRHL